MLPTCILRERTELAERTATVLESLAPAAATEFQQSLDEEIAKIRSDIRRAARECAAGPASDRLNGATHTSGYEAYSA